MKPYAIGSYVRYRGSIHPFNIRTCKISDIVAAFSEYRLELLNPQQSGSHKIAASKEEIVPILLGEDSLQSSGFAIDSNTKIWSDGISRIVKDSKVNVVDKENHLLEYEDNGFKILPCTESDGTFDKIKADGEQINYLHELQDYYLRKFKTDLKYQSIW